jgi:hypothetical protein
MTPRTALQPDSSIAFLTRDLTPSASDRALTAWAIFALAIVVATLLVGAR